MLLDMLNPANATMGLLLLILLGGLALIVIGADWLVDGSTAIARKLKVSEFVIGLTIVGMGTSTPEMVVSFMGALQGNADIAVGNVVGSNIFNVLFILGVTAMIWPMNMTKSNMKRDIPINIGVTLLLIFLGMNKTITGCGNNVLSRLDGALFLILFAIYLITAFRQKPKFPSDTAETKTIRTPIAALSILLGLGGLILGGNLFVNYATEIATRIGVSDKFIAVTVLAAGTSMPELATCVAAALKKRGQLALGNILGSNIFNILFILGGSALICPLSFDGGGQPNSGMNYVDLSVLLLSAILLWSSAYTGHRRRLDRADGLILLLVAVGYMIWLLIHL
jgi:cation:H+ antiporter